MLKNSLIACLLLLVSGIGHSAFALPVDDFVITVKTDNLGSSSGIQFTIPTEGMGYDYNVDCDDADPGTNISPVGQIGNYTCDYLSAGTYTIRIKDNSGASTGFPRIYFNDAGDKLKIISLDQWGTGKWTSMAKAFYGASNMLVPATDVPDFSAMISMYAMFSTASVADPDTSNWNTAGITDMGYLFYFASAATPDTANWDTAAVTNMFAMFSAASLANPDTTGWDTAAVTDMAYLFWQAESATPNTTHWNTALVTNMYALFAEAPLVNPNTSGTGWNTAAVTDMGFMFTDSISANPNTQGWDISNVTKMRGMFNGVTLPTASYDAMLIGFEAQSLQANVEFSGGDSNYCAAVAARADMEAPPNNWIITDGEHDCTPVTPSNAPDLHDASDSGESNVDNLTADNGANFEVVCAETANIVTLYTDNPTTNTAIGSHTCVGAGIESVSVSPPLADGVHNISYTETKLTAESEHSPTLAVTIDTIAPADPNVTSTLPSPANNGTVITTLLTAVENDATVTVMGMVCSPSPADVTGNVMCTGTVGQNSLDGSDTTITVNDAAGNTNITQSTGLMVDNAAPTQPVCATTPNPANNGTAITTSCTNVETGATITIPNMSCLSTGATTVDCTGMIGTGVGEVSVNDDAVTITDPVGNSDTSATTGLMVDNTAPTQPICATTPNPANNGTAITTSCTNVETGATITIPNMSCLSTGATTVDCTGMIGTGVGEVSVNNDAVTITDPAGNADSSATTGLNIVVFGDCTGDGLVNIADVICTINIVLNTGLPNGNGADVDGDDTVDITDVINTINIVLMP